MYCPRCATENGEEQKFCRRCGLSLAGVRFALAGRVEEAEPLFKKAQNLVAWALTIFGITAVNSLLNSHDPSAMIFTALVGGALLLTVLIFAAARLSAARKLFGARQPSDAAPDAAPDAGELPAVEGAAATNPQLPPAPAADPLEAFRAPRSVVEGTTVKLREPEKARRPRPE